MACPAVRADAHDRQASSLISPGPHECTTVGTSGPVLLPYFQCHRDHCHWAPQSRQRLRQRPFSCQLARCLWRQSRRRHHDFRITVSTPRVRFCSCTIVIADVGGGPRHCGHRCLSSGSATAGRTMRSRAGLLAVVDPDRGLTPAPPDFRPSTDLHRGPPPCNGLLQVFL